MASKQKAPTDLLTDVPARKPVTTPSVVEVEEGALVAVTKMAPDEARNARRVEVLLNMARSITITNAQEYEMAAGELRRVKAVWDELETERTSLTGPLNEVLKKLNARFQPYLKALCGETGKKMECAESILKAKMAAFQAAEEARAREERRKAEEAAEAERQRLAREAAELRRKAEAEAEAIRQAEAKRQAEAAAAQKALDDAAAAARSKKAKQEAAERAEAARIANERLAAEATARAELAAQQAEELAQANELAAAVVIAQPVATPVTKAAGIVTTKSFDFEVTDLLALAKHIVEKRPDLVVLLATDSVKIRAHVKTFGENAALPGLRVFTKSGITVR